MPDSLPVKWPVVSLGRKDYELRRSFFSTYLLEGTDFSGTDKPAHKIMTLFAALAAWQYAERGASVPSGDFWAYQVALEPDPTAKAAEITEAVMEALRKVLPETIAASAPAAMA